MADRLGREAILIDIKPSYVKMAKMRIEQDAPLFTELVEMGAIEGEPRSTQVMLLR